MLRNSNLYFFPFACIWTYWFFALGCIAAKGGKQLVEFSLVAVFTVSTDMRSQQKSFKI